MQRYSTSLVITEIKIKTMMMNHFIATKKTELKRILMILLIRMWNRESPDSLLMER